MQNGKNYTMKLKGTSLNNVNKFEKNNFASQYEQWLENLLEKSKNIFYSLVLSTNWYKKKDGYIDSVKTIAKLFYESKDTKVVQEVSKYNALTSLQGVYKIFIRVASLNFVVKRAVSIFKTYYSAEAQIEV